MPTICGLRRRGYTPASIRNFSERNGVSKVNSTVEYAFLEYCLREDLNQNARRAMAVLDPVKLTITNYPEDKTELFDVENNPNKPEEGTRPVSFSRTVYIEREDFLEAPVPKYKRLYPEGPECRLKGAYLIRCTGCRKDEEGNIVEDVYKRQLLPGLLQQRDARDRYKESVLGAEEDYLECMIEFISGDFFTVVCQAIEVPDEKVYWAK